MSARRSAGEPLRPGSRTNATRISGGFFRNTLPVLDQAYLRPTHPGFVPFFHDATLRLAAVVFEDAPLRPFIDWLNDRYEQIRPKAAAAAN